MRESNDAAREARYQPAQIRRHQILEAAAELATTRGLEATSIADVAREAGVAKGSIYLHFRSRDDLIAALQTRVWGEMMEIPRLAASNEDLTWVGRLDVVVEHWMRYEFEHHELYHAVFHAVATVGDEPWNEARTLLRRLIVSGSAAGEFCLDELDPDVVVEFLLHAYVGPCYHHTNIDTAITDVQQLFRRTIGCSEPPPVRASV